MEKLIKNLLVATGLIASAAVALLPLTSYAVAVTDTSDPHGVYNCDDTTGSVPCARSDIQTHVDSEGNPTEDTGPTVVTVEVQELLAIDAVSLTCTGENDTCVDVDGGGSKAIQAFPNTVRTGTFGVNIRSAKPFTISLSADAPYMMGYDSEGNNTGFIIPASNNLDGKNNGWGIQKFGETAYTALSAQPQVFYTSDVPQDDLGYINFRVGVSANSNLPQGMYSTEVIVTAAIDSTN